MSQREEISRELRRIEEASKWSAQCQFEQAKIWRATHLWLAAPSATLAAVSGGGLLADEFSATLSGLLALLAAALGALSAALGASEKAAECKNSGNEYLAVQGKARRSRCVQLPDQDIAQAMHNLESLAERQDEINSVAHVIHRKAYNRSRRNIESDGGQTFEVDND